MPFNKNFVAGARRWLQSAVTPGFRPVTSVRPIFLPKDDHSQLTLMLRKDPNSPELNAQEESARVEKAWNILDRALPDNYHRAKYPPYVKVNPDDLPPTVGYLVKQIDKGAGLPGVYVRKTAYEKFLTLEQYKNDVLTANDLLLPTEIKNLGIAPFKGILQHENQIFVEVKTQEVPLAKRMRLQGIVSQKAMELGVKGPTEEVALGGFGVG